jgi:hypothetical protein
MGFRMYMLRQDFWLDGGVRFAGFLMCCHESLEMYPLPSWTFLPLLMWWMFLHSYDSEIRREA